MESADEIFKRLEEEIALINKTKRKNRMLVRRSEFLWYVKNVFEVLKYKVGIGSKWVIRFEFIMRGYVILKPFATKNEFTTDPRYLGIEKATKFRFKCVARFWAYVFNETQFPYTFSVQEYFDLN